MDLGYSGLLEQALGLVLGLTWMGMLLEERQVQCQEEGQVLKFQEGAMWLIVLSWGKKGAPTFVLPTFARPQYFARGFEDIYA